MRFLSASVGGLLIVAIPAALLLSAGSCASVQTPATGSTESTGSVAFANKARAMKLSLPAGWETATVDPVVGAALSGLNVGGAVGFRKADRGKLAVWCDRFDSARSDHQHLEDVLARFAPLNRRLAARDVEAPNSGWLSRPQVITYRAERVEKGERVAFGLATVAKTPPVADQLKRACNYMLLGWSSTEQSSREILDDVGVIAATLEHPVTDAEFEAENAKYQAAADRIRGDPAARKAQYKELGEKIFRDLEAKQARKTQEKAPEKPREFGAVAHDDSVRWQLVANDLTDDLTTLRLVAPDRLLLTVEGKAPRLVDTAGGAQVWQLDHTGADRLREPQANPDPFASKPTFDYVCTNEGALIFRAEGAGKSSVHSVELGTGKERWGVVLEAAGALELLPVPTLGLLLAVQVDGRTARVTAISLLSGSVAWTARSRSPVGTTPQPPLVDEDGLWTWSDGVARRSAASGAVTWNRAEITLGKQSPPMALDGRRLLVIDEGNRLHLLDAATGRTTTSAALRAGVHYTDIYPMGDRIYLRGVAPGAKGEGRFFLTALRRSDGRELWSDIDAEPSVSNLIEAGGRLYHATTSTVVALDRETGLRRFAARAASTGRTYPVRVRLYGRSVVYLGELVVAAFDAELGTPVYRYGFDPVDQTSHLDAVTANIEFTTEALSFFTYPLSGVDFSGAGLSAAFMQQAIHSQNQAREQDQLVSKYARSYNMTGDQSALLHHDIARLHAVNDAAMANAQASIGMAFGIVENVQASIAKVAAPEQRKMRDLLHLRRFLVTAHQAHQQGDFAVRAAVEGDALGVAVIHLPSGAMRRTPLPGSSGLRDTFNLVDLDRQVVYVGAWLSTPASGKYLVARPVAIPR
jgi:outer membrane protein assembly factor BamB